MNICNSQILKINSCSVAWEDQRQNYSTVVYLSSVLYEITSVLYTKYSTTHIVNYLLLSAVLVSIIGITVLCVFTETFQLLTRGVV